MWPFRRRSRTGRHELGAAVTAIPATPRVPEQPLPSYGGQAAPSGPVDAPEPPVQPGPRVELGFRDGTTAALAPGSDSARALTAIAAVLTQRS